MVPGDRGEEGPAGEPGSCRTGRGPIPQDTLEMLVNGVFAFAMTIIVKNNIPIPSGNPPTVPGGLGESSRAFTWNYADHIISDGLNFIFTFVILATFYLMYFEMLRYMRRIDRTFTILSFGFLLSIVFVPLTSLLWVFSDIRIPYSLLFHLNVLACGLVTILLWWYASRYRGLLVPDTSPRVIKNISQKLLLFPATAVAALILDGLWTQFEPDPVILLYAVPLILFGMMTVDPFAAEPRETPGQETEKPV